MNNDNLAGKAAALEGELLGASEGAPGAPGAAPDDELGQAPAAPTNAELLTALLRPTFDIMAPEWRVSDDECAMLGAAYGAVIDKYFPDFQMGVELTALLVTAAVIGPRMRRPVKPTPAADAAPLAA